MKRSICMMGVCLAVLFATAGQAQAQVITFNSFPTGIFAGGTESGYTIAATNAQVWSAVYGFPTLSVGSNAPNTTSTYTFTTAGLFQFNGLELVFPGFSGVPGPVSAEGYVGATLLGTDVFPVPGVAATPTGYSSSNLSGLMLDRLVLSTTSNFAQTTLIDNVSLTAVPEPSFLALFGVGASVMGISAARRRQRETIRRGLTHPRKRQA